MPSARLLALACLAVLPLACGSSTSDDPGTGGSSGSGGFTKLDPAANVDVTTCADIHIIEDNATSHCSTCCSAVDAVSSSFINEGACTCARPREEDASKTVCASAVESGDACSACCSDAGYLISGWVGAETVTQTAGQCGCAGLQDKMICADHAQSEDACTNCCMHEGFISYGYGSSVGCWCIG